MTNTMTSAAIKATFAEAGIKVRVRDFCRKFRIVPTKYTFNAPAWDRELVSAILNNIGLTTAFGAPISRSVFNGYNEICAYKQ